MPPETELQPDTGLDGRTDPIPDATRPFDDQGRRAPIDVSLFEDHLIQVMLQDPDIFYALDAKSLGKDFESGAYLLFMKGKVTIHELVRMVPGVEVSIGLGAEVAIDVGGLTREGLMIEHEEWDAERKRTGRRELLGRYERVKQLAHEVSESAFAQRDGTPVVNPELLELLDELRPFGDLPHAVSEDAIRAFHPDVASAWRRLGLDEDDDKLQQLRAGSITIQQFLESRNVTIEEFHNVVQNITNIEIEVPGASEVGSVDERREIRIPPRFLFTDAEAEQLRREEFFQGARDALGRLDSRLEELGGATGSDAVRERSDLEDKKRRVERSVSEFQQRISLQEHDFAVQEARNLIGNFSTLLRVLDPEIANDVYQIGNGLIKVVDSVGSMVINGALSFGGIASVVNGISLIASVFGDSKSPEQLILEALSRVLKNQQRILERLHEIEHKIDVLQGHVDYLIDMSRREFLLAREERVQIQRKLMEIREDVYRLDRRGQARAQEAIAAKVRIESFAALAIFDNPMLRSSANEIRRFVEEGLPDPSPPAWRRVQATLQSIAGLLLTSASRPPFVESESLRSLDVERLAHLTQQPMEDRVGYLPDLDRWVGATRDAESTPEHTPSRVLESLPHPSYVTEFVRRYVALARRLPEQSQVRDGNLPELSPLVEQVYRAGQQLQQLAPEARRVYMRNARTAAKTVTRFTAQASVRLPALNDSSKVLFAELSDQEMADALIALPPPDLFELARRFELVESRTAVRFRPAGQIDSGDGSIFLFEREETTIAVAMDGSALKGDLFTISILSRSTSRPSIPDRMPAPKDTGGDPPDDAAQKEARSDLERLVMGKLKHVHRAILADWNALVLDPERGAVFRELSIARLALDSCIRGGFGHRTREKPLATLLGRLIGGEHARSLRSLPALLRFGTRCRELEELPALPEGHDELAADLGRIGLALGSLTMAASFPDLHPKWSFDPRRQ